MDTLIIKSNDRKAAALASSVMKKGGIVVYPTETSYGIGCDYTNKKACKKIFYLKKRPLSKNMVTIVSSISMAIKYAKLTNDEIRAARKLMPGPLTIAVNDKFSFRVSSNRFARTIAKKLARPIVSTSANMSGGSDNYRIKDVIRLFSGKVDLIIDGGNLKKVRPSTIVNLRDGINIIRKGPVSKKKIMKSLR
jgi:tRNA threonylcarbamoyl adenosine modification protein (Sua5/YciO/YrdC/YwlC family)